MCEWPCTNPNVIRDHVLQHHFYWPIIVHYTVLISAPTLFDIYWCNVQEVSLLYFFLKTSTEWFHKQRGVTILIQMPSHPHFPHTPDSTSVTLIDNTYFNFNRFTRHKYDWRSSKAFSIKASVIIKLRSYNGWLISAHSYSCCLWNHSLDVLGRKLQ